MQPRSVLAPDLHPRLQSRGARCAEHMTCRLMWLRYATSLFFLKIQWCTIVYGTKITRFDITRSGDFQRYCDADPDPQIIHMIVSSHQGSGPARIETSSQSELETSTATAHRPRTHDPRRPNPRAHACAGRSRGVVESHAGRPVVCYVQLRQRFLPFFQVISPSSSPSPCRRDRPTFISSTCSGFYYRA